MTRDILDYLGNVIGQLNLPDDTSEEVWEERLSRFAIDPNAALQFIYPSLAVDKGPDDGIDQSITNDEWTTINAEQILWDKNNDFDLAESKFTVHWDGIYSHDSQIFVKELVNCRAVELAVFKKEDPSDDYWFILGKQFTNGETEIHISGATSFNFYAGEEYLLKIKLYKEDSSLDVSGTISGSDDYTAWGFNYIRDL